MNRKRHLRILQSATALLLLAAALALPRILRSLSAAPAQRAPDSASRIAAYRRQIAELADVPESQILFREGPPLEIPGLSALTSVACAGDRIAAGGGRNIVVLASRGEVLLRLSVPADLTCLALDAQGRLYAGLGSAIRAFDASGRTTADFQGLAPDALITSLLTSDEAVFAADARNRCVLGFTPEGALRQTFHSPADAEDQAGFLVPSPYFDLAAGQGRTLWVVNPGRLRLEEYSFDGEYIGAWPEQAGMHIEAFCGCCNPAHIASLPDGGIATAEKGIPRIKVYSRRGAFRGVVAPPQLFEGFDLGIDLAADAGGRILVADPFRRQVRVFVQRSGPPP